MAELMLLRQDADGQDVELSGSTVALEVELQQRVEAGLERMLGIRFLASEYATGPWHRGRIDTLGLDGPVSTQSGRPGHGPPGPR